jgi:serine/threonine protein kinase
MADITTQLRELSKLRDEGILTEEEFNRKKGQLLNEPSTRSGIEGAEQPKEIGAYTIEGLIGQGGMGVVYRGRHRSAPMAERQGGSVAIKLMHAHFARKPGFQERFEREASLGLKLDHPGIVKVHDLIVDGGNLALVMEEIQGRELAEIIGQETGPIPWVRAWPLFRQLLDAMGHAHDGGVVHRDLKPENILVGGDGRLKVLDFGIAKDLEGGNTKTGTGMGTINYMAPEQYTDAKFVDHRADIYALGMTLYEMLAGRLPWDHATTDFEVLNRKVQGHLPPPTDYYPDIPDEVVTAMNRALAVDRDERWNSTAEFAEALEGKIAAGSSWNQPQPAATPQPPAVSPPPVATPQPPAVSPPPAATPQPPAVSPPPVAEPQRSGALAREQSIAAAPPPTTSPSSGKVIVIAILLVAGVVSALIAYLALSSGTTQEGDTTAAPLLDMVLVRANTGETTFQMGSPPGSRSRDKDEGWQQVRVSRPFEMSATEVTQAQYREVMGYNPVETRRRQWGSNPKPEKSCSLYGLGNNMPVHCISWYEAVQFANALSAREGLSPAYEIINSEVVRWNSLAAGYRLPTEVEWEFAARARGKNGETYQGNSNNASSLCRIANVSNPSTRSADARWGKRGDLGCEDGNPTLAPVASRAPVAGLYDMTGNLWEWVWDGYRSHASRPLTGVDASVAPTPGGKVVLRGATWHGPASDYRLGNRYSQSPHNHSYFVGFRVARSLGE